MTFFLAKRDLLMAPRLSALLLCKVNEDYSIIFLLASPNIIPLVAENFYSLMRMCFLWSDSVLALIPTQAPTRPISAQPSPGGDDMSQEPEFNEASFTQ